MRRALLLAMTAILAGSNLSAQHALVHDGDGAEQCAAVLGDELLESERNPG